MASIRQKRLAKAIIENSQSPKGKTAGQLLESVGYPHSTATTYPGAVIEQKGVQEELQNLGFDEESAKKVVKSILTKGKDENRLKAADMIFKVTGGYAPEKSINLNASLDTNDDQALAEAAKAYGLASIQRKIS